ncbi:Uncharacterised protein [Klebsiella pneumoniae]|nr:Uncharacterised protein [Klebsiella pneumoniae]
MCSITQNHHTTFIKLCERFNIMDFYPIGFLWV